MTFVPAAAKGDALDRLGTLLGARYSLKRGSTIPEQVFTDACVFVGVDASGTMPSRAARIAETCGEVWGSQSFSSGSTVTLVGLNQVLKAVERRAELDVGFASELAQHLTQSGGAPMLFVGSGLSRRYLGTPDWDGLLSTLAEATSHPYARYKSEANGDLPQAASLIGERFHDIWWDSDAYARQRERHPTPAKRSSPLKIAAAALLETMAQEIPTTGTLAREIAFLKRGVVEGVITTNFDTLLEGIFPEFDVYNGQDDLLFQAPQGIAEIYKIHGTATHPESIVLTKEDYDWFRKRNPYLAAKLLSIFVEHPIVFLGYSVSDVNVREILGSLSSVLTPRNLSRLAERLILVEWDPTISRPTMTTTEISLGDHAIPTRLVRAPDFVEVFRSLSFLKQRIPAHVLRHLKKQVYDFVLTSEPTSTLYVGDLSKAESTDDVEFVVGVGVIDEIANKGLVGLTRDDLLDDLLHPKYRVINHREIVRRVLPELAKTNSYLPIFRYLRGAGHLADDGTLQNADVLAAALHQRALAGVESARPPGAGRVRAAAIADRYPSMTDLLAQASVEHALAAIPMHEPSRIHIEPLRDYLIANKRTDSHHTDWVRSVCFLDACESLLGF